MVDITSSRLSGDRETIPSSSEYSMPQQRLHGLRHRGLPFFPGFLSIFTMFAIISSSLAMSSTDTMSIVAKKRLNSSSARFHPCRSSWTTSSQSVHVPSSIRTCALIPL